MLPNNLSKQLLYKLGRTKQLSTRNQELVQISHCDLSRKITENGIVIQSNRGKTTLPFEKFIVNYDQAQKNHPVIHKVIFGVQEKQDKWLPCKNEKELHKYLRK